VPASEKVIRGPEGGQFTCPCCRYLTLPSRGGDDICPVCFLEDDGQDDPFADEVWGGPNYDLSLTQARANFGEFGAVAREMKAHVRDPLLNEIPVPPHIP
jgi:Cysteine-rich CPCC